MAIGIAEYVFTAAGQRIYPVAAKINGVNYVRVTLDDVPFTDSTQFDIINNSIVFTDEAAPTTGTEVKIYVATSEEFLSNFDVGVANPTNLDVVGEDLALGEESVITIVGNNISYIQDISDNTLDIAAVASNIDEVVIVGTIANNIATVANNTTNINTVATNNNNITTVANNTTNITTVANNNTTITAVANNATNINAVNSNKTNIDTVAGNNSNITTVAGISTKVTTVANNIDDVGNVSDNMSDINDVQNYLDDIATVSGAVGNVNTIATNIVKVNTVSTNISNVNTVADSITDVNTVASNITDINTFADTYFISATAPSSPTEGDLWFDTTANFMKVYDGNGFIAAGSSVNGTSSRNTYTATAGQTTFSSTYDVGYVDVYRNGLKLAPSDFTATNGTTVVLNNACSLNDIVDIVAYGTFELADAYTKNDADVLLAAKAPLASPALTGTPTVNGVAFNGYSGLKNRIINGAMMIDQRNAGASVTGNDNVFIVDRWRTETTQSSKLTGQKNQGGITPPAGFKNYLGLTSSSAYSITASDRFNLTQWIEGFNAEDLDFGTSNAKTITLSFWVRSSLTGTFGGTIGGYNQGAGTFRTYPYSYTISSANTWEQKSITIPGDTTTFSYGTGNGYGLFVCFGLGNGSNNSGTANAWQAGLVYAPTGATSVVGTNGATFYITGVQLEKGSTATSFDYRPYGTELDLCQRYYQIGNWHVRTTNQTSLEYYTLAFRTTMRTSPTMTVSTWSVADITNNSFLIITPNATGTQDSGASSYTASAEL